MPKKGYNPFEKQSSTTSNEQVLNLMAEYNFAVQRLGTPVEPRATTRSAVNSAKRKFGDFAHISASGESVFFQGNHVESGRPVRDVCVKLSNMLGLGELKALYRATGIPELNPVR